jgi:hypothetical protein
VAVAPLLCGLHAVVAVMRFACQNENGCGEHGVIAVAPPHHHVTQSSHNINAIAVAPVAYLTA